MKKEILHALVVTGTVFSLVAIHVSFAPMAQAVTAEEISEQRRVVMSGLVDVLREQVKLFQLLVIDRLETQVAQLEARLDNK